MRAPQRMGNDRSSFYGDTPFEDADWELDQYETVMNGNRNDDMESLDYLYNPDNVLLSCPAVTAHGKSGYLNYDRVGLDVDRDDPAERLKGHKEQIEYDDMWNNGPDMNGSMGANFQVEYTAQANARDLAQYSVKSAGGHGAGDNMRTKGFCNGQIMTDRMPARRRAQDRYWREEPVRKNQLVNEHPPNATWALPKEGVTQRGIEQEFRRNWRNDIMTQPVTNYHDTLRQKGWTNESVGGYIGQAPTEDKQVRGIHVKETHSYVGAPSVQVKQPSFEKYANRSNKHLVDYERNWVGNPAGAAMSQGGYIQQEVHMRKPWKVQAEDTITQLNSQRGSGGQYAVDSKLVAGCTDESKTPYRYMMEEKTMELNDPRGGLDSIYARTEPRGSLRHQQEVGNQIKGAGLALDNAESRDEQQKTVSRDTRRMDQRERVVGSGMYNNSSRGIYERVRNDRPRLVIEEQPDKELLQAYMENPYTRPITNM